MEENELEEGEARSGNEEEGEDCMDPDVTLSYIDEKIQDVLGHFQKDFEGGVSVENLGAKFGGYGSFLPMYQRSLSIWSQPKSPPKASSPNGSTSSFDPSLEGTSCIPSSEMGTPFSKNNNTSSTAQLLKNSDKKDTLASSFTAGDLSPQHNSSNKQNNGSDQRTLKVRIKVGSDNILARNNADIYSGLGLDISPSPSLEDSPISSGGLSPALGGAPSETPTTILQIMTCLPVPGGYVLSPLPEGLLHLTEKRSPYLKNSKTGPFCNGTSETLANLTQTMKDVNSCAGKKPNPNEKSRAFTGAKNLNCKNETGTEVKEEVGISTVREVVSHGSNIPPLSSSSAIDGKAERHMIGESAKSSYRIYDLSREPHMISSPHRKCLLKNQLESIGNMEIRGLCTSGSETTHLNEKLNARTNLAERASEKRNMSNQNVALSGLCRENGDKVCEDYGINKVSYARNSKTKGHSISPTELVKQKPARKANSFEEDRENILHDAEQLSEGNRKLKKGQAIATLSMELPKENLKSLSSLSLEEKKRRFHIRGDFHENLSESMKSYKEPNEHLDRGVHDDLVDGTRVDQVNVKGCFSETHREDKPKDVELENDKSKEVLGSKKFGNPSSSEALVEASIMYNALTLNGIAAPRDPVVIHDNWVLCDKCKKWRLLPYGKDPRDLPKKWRCKKLDWLTGMNNCQVSQEETTKALYALYQLPVPGGDCGVNGHTDVAASSVTLADEGHLHQNLQPTMADLPACNKKKYAVKDASSLPSQSAVIRVSNSVGKAQEASIKTGSLDDTDQAPLELDTVNKNGFRLKGKSVELTTEVHELKPKGKQNMFGCFSNGGDFIDRSDKHSKFKSKRIVSQDGRAPKKMKSEGSHQPVEDRHSDDAVSGKAASITDNGMLAKVHGMNLQKYDDNSSLKDSKYNSKDVFPFSGNKSNEQGQAFSPKELKENFDISDMEISDKLDLASKKRKVKEPQGSLGLPIRSQHLGDDGLITKEELSESALLNEKKANLSKSEEKELSTRRADDRADKEGHISGILVSADKADRIEEVRRDLNGHERLAEQHQGSTSCRGALDGIDSLKKDLGSAWPLITGTSSSSMVSGSCKNKTYFQDGRGSPVESISSSPLRVPDRDTLSTRGNSVAMEDFLNSDFMSSKRCSDDDVGGGCDQSGGKERHPSAQQRSFVSHGSVGLGVIESAGGTFSSEDKLENKLSGVEVKGGMHFRTSVGTHDVPFPAGFGELNVINGVAKANKSIGEPSEKEQVRVKDKSRVHNQGNGYRQCELANSSCFKDRTSSSGSDLEKDKLKNIDCPNNQEEFYVAKKGRSFQSKAGVDYQQHSVHHQHLGDKHCNFKEKDGKDHPGKKEGNMCRKEYQKNADGDSSRHLKQLKDFNSTARVAEINCGQSFVHKNLEEPPLAKVEKSPSQLVSDRLEKSEIETGQGNSDVVLPPGDKQEMQIRACHSIPTPVKESCSQAYPIGAANGDRSKMVNQPKKSEMQDFEPCGSSKQPAPNELNARNPFRKDRYSSVNVILKEARNLKHMADRLKSEGQELEITSLYFQAALKYLHGASLLEPSSIESAKHGGVAQSMKIYSDTAKLCEFCAHEYERRREMAAAALAYKCVEVAYFKVAYHKHPIASKCRHELQTALQMVPPGESPSSSASDIDNLNNNGLLDKAVAVKGVCSPQIAGTYVIAAHNRSNINRWLEYMNEMIFAFEASRKSQNAFAVANASQEKYGSDGLSSVRKVLDLSFHNIQGLLRLVRLSIESISI